MPSLFAGKISVGDVGNMFGFFFRCCFVHTGKQYEPHLDLLLCVLPVTADYFFQNTEKCHGCLIS